MIRSGYKDDSPDWRFLRRFQAAIPGENGASWKGRRYSLKLKQNIDLLEFLQVCRHCKEDVYFCTGNGDRLDLKSELMGFVFLSHKDNEAFLYESTIELDAAEDRDSLLPFLAE